MADEAAAILKAARIRRQKAAASIAPPTTPEDPELVKLRLGRSSKPEGEKQSRKKKDRTIPMHGRPEEKQSCKVKRKLSFADADTGTKKKVDLTKFELKGGQQPCFELQSDISQSDWEKTPQASDTSGVRHRKREKGPEIKQAPVAKEQPQGGNDETQEYSTDQALADDQWKEEKWKLRNGLGADDDDDVLVEVEESKEEPPRHDAKEGPASKKPSKEQAPSKEKPSTGKEQALAGDEGEAKEPKKKKEIAKDQGEQKKPAQRKAIAGDEGDAKEPKKKKEVAKDQGEEKKPEQRKAVAGDEGNGNGPKARRPRKQPEASKANDDETNRPDFDLDHYEYPGKYSASSKGPPEQQQPKSPRKRKSRTPKKTEEPECEEKPSAAKAKAKRAKAGASPKKKVTAEEGPCGGDGSNKPKKASKATEPVAEILRANTAELTTPKSNDEKDEEEEEYNKLNEQDQKDKEEKMKAYKARKAKFYRSLLSMGPRWRHRKRRQSSSSPNKDDPESGSSEDGEQSSEAEDPKKKKTKDKKKKEGKKRDKNKTKKTKKKKKETDEDKQKRLQKEEKKAEAKKKKQEEREEAAMRNSRKQERMALCDGSYFGEAGTLQVAGLASLVGVEKIQPLHEWQTAIKAARTAGKIPSSAEDFDRAETPQATALQVGQCGWSDCHGIFHRNGPLQFNLGPGLLSIVYVEALKAWCLLAEVAPLYPLREQRLYLGLDEGSHGAQLLYIRRSSCVLGQWEPVIGPAPGPEVTIYKEVAVRQVDLQVRTAQTSVISVASGVGSMVLDILFNFFDADWRGGIEHGNVWGLSAVEAMLDCSAVCRSWNNALLPFNNLKKICYHALQIKSPTKLKLPTVPDAMMAIMCAGCCWNNGLKITDSSAFQGRAWPAYVSEVRLLSEMGEDEDHFLCGETPALLNKLAGTFLQVMRQMLHGIQLAWKTKPSALGMITTSNGKRFASCDLLDFVRVERQCHAFMETDSEGHMKLFSHDGVELLPHRWNILEPLLSKGLRLESAVRRWTSTRLEPRGPGEPCGFPFCQKLDIPCHICANDLQGRTRLGASQLSGGYTMEFREDAQLQAAPRRIILEMDVKLIPFFATSQDFSLVRQLWDLLPWSNTDIDDIESECKDWNDDSTADLEEDCDDDSIAEDPPRRRLRGKQPPPPEWQD
eukprot:Skav227059  [mRNA]  locus=scaffold72:918234:929362:- [translate_table: standard]